MRQPPSDRRLRHMLWGSLTGHLLALALLLGWAQLSHLRTPPPQNVLITKLVRLGKQRPKELLPQKEMAAKTPSPPAATPLPTPAALSPAPTTAAAIAPPAATRPTAQARARALSRVNSAVAKLKRAAVGEADGAVDGETDLAQQGDQFASEINRCIHEHYVIRGVDAARTKGKSAEVKLWINRDGKITGHRIVHGTGLSAMDQAIGEAIKGCARVSAPPAALRDEIRTLGVAMTFTP